MDTDERSEKRRVRRGVKRERTGGELGELGG